MKKNNFYLDTIKFGVILIIFVTPFLYGSPLLFPALFSKTIFFRIMIEIIFIFYLLLALSNPRYRPRFSLISLSIIFFFITLILTSFLGVNPYRSFWGTFERMEGVSTLLHLGIFFFVLIYVFKDPKFWLRFFQISLIASLFISLYIIILGVIHGQIIDYCYQAFFRNPAFLAFFLLFNVFFAWLFFLKENKKELRLFYFFILIIDSSLIVLSENRGATVAIFSGFLFFILFYISLSSISKKKKCFIFGIISIFFLLFLLFAPIIRDRIKDQPWVQDYTFLQKLTQISLEAPTIKSRLLSWQVAFNGWRERFWLGWGWENYKIVFDKHSTPQMLLYAFQSFDRVHNKILDVGVMSGFLGLLSYFFIFFAIFYILIKSLFQRKMNFRLVGAIMALFIAYFINNLFLFDTLNSYILFFLTIGFVEIMSRTESDEAGQENYIPATSRKKISLLRISYILVFWLIILISFFSYQINVKPTLASYYGRQGLDWEDKDYSKSLNFYKKSLTFSTYGDHALRIRLAFLVVEKRQEDPLSEQRIEDLKYVADVLKKNLGDLPDLTDYESHFLLGKTYNLLGKIDKSYLELAEKSLKEGLKINRFRPDIYTELAENRVLQDDIEGALSFYLQARELNLEIPGPYWNLGKFYLEINEKEKALVELEKALEIEDKFGLHPSLGNLAFLFNLYGEKKEFQKLISLYEETIHHYKNISVEHPLYGHYLNLYKSLAATYAEIDEKEKAKETAFKLLEIDPNSYNEVQKFLESLEVENSGK